MAKYVNASKMLEKYQDSIYDTTDLAEMLDYMPAADVVEVRHGYWIEMADFEQCSVCQGTHLKEFQTYYGKVVWVKTPYCPNCGAKMDGE